MSITIEPIMSLHIFSYKMQDAYHDQLVYLGFVSDAKSQFGCEAQEISISCSEGKTIMVSKADYGNYSVVGNSNIYIGRIQ